MVFIFANFQFFDDFLFVHTSREKYLQIIKTTLILQIKLLLAIKLLYFLLQTVFQLLSSVIHIIIKK